MEVETYEEISLDEQQGNIINEVVSEEAMALIESLGLEGQKKLFEEREVDGEQVVTRNPYRMMTGEEMNVYGIVMSRKTALASYDEGPIPLRVLQVASHAKELFDEVTVWHPKPGYKDPILVGTRKRSSYGIDTFILARWGEVLEPFETLREKAKTILEARMKKEIAEAEAKLTKFKAAAIASIDDYLQGGDAPSEYFSLSFR